MKRFIRYLYEYQNGQRIRNVGFVKVEQQEENTIIHIHGKGLHLTEDRTLKVYIFYLKGGQCTGIWQGDIENVNPAVNYRLLFTPEDTGRKENYARIEGVILENENKCRFAAVWDDTPVDVEKMQLWKDEPELDIVQMVEKKAAEEEEEDDWIDTGNEGEETEDEEGGMPECEENKGPSVPSPTKYIKIHRQDIASLRRCEWRLANNSFLLHGYYNYHHLILLEEEGQCFLGVPGVYHEREARAAEAFGFPRFRAMDEGAVELDENERNDDEKFGYWCRQVKR